MEGLTQLKEQEIHKALGIERKGEKKQDDRKVTADIIRTEKIHQEEYS